MRFEFGGNATKLRMSPADDSSSPKIADSLVYNCGHRDRMLATTSARSQSRPRSMCRYTLTMSPGTQICEIGGAAADACTRSETVVAVNPDHRPTAWRETWRPGSWICRMAAGSILLPGFFGILSLWRWRSRRSGLVHRGVYRCACAPTNLASAGAGAHPGCDENRFFVYVVVCQGACRWTGTYA